MIGDLKNGTVIEIDDINKTENKIKKWYRLDNAAKIYPATATSVWAAVFRVSVTFKDEIDMEKLQIALERTAKRAPAIAARVRKGFFWYYMEPLDKKPVLQPDVQNPCMKMSADENEGFNFRVRVYGKRVALEVYHALADGTGAFIFLKTLAAEYLKQKGINIPEYNGILNCDDQPEPEEMEDGHNKFSQFRINEKRTDKRAYYLKGTKEPFDEVHITTGILPCDQVKKRAREKKLTITEYLAGIYCYVLYKIQEDENPRRKRPVIISLPVNLRPYYNSKTMRNFAYFINAGINPNYGDFTQDEIFEEIHYFFKHSLNEKYLNAKISKNVSAERNPILRIVPRSIKDVAMNFTYKFVGDSRNTSTLSNLGLADIPGEMNDHIDRFDFMLGRSRFTNVNCAVVGFQNKLVINFTRGIKEPYVERAFFRELVKRGIPVEIESNQEVE